MGMVFQNYAVWPHKTVFENVVFGLKMRKVPAAEARQQVEETLGAGQPHRAREALSERAVRRPAAARRARPQLVVEPTILLLDEPLSNLDAKLRERMRGELKDLQRRTGITFVYVTHDQAEALALSDQIAVMHGGRLQQYGTPLEVYARPANRMVADFMGLVNLVPGTVRAVANGSGTDRARGRPRRSMSASLDGLAAGRHRRGRHPAGEHPARARASTAQVRAAPRSGDDHQPRLPRQHQRISCGAAVRPGAARADPSAAAFRGRRYGRGRDRRDPMQRVPPRSRRRSGS